MTKICVTGADGYIGSHVVSTLLDMGYSVMATDITNRRIDSRAEYLSKNIFEEDDNIYENLGCPDVLLHLAWIDGFVHNSENHLKYLFRHYSFIKKMIESGTKNISVMGTMHEVGFYEGKLDEKVPCNPSSLYGISKNALRQALDVLNNTLSFNFHWLRGFYICGDDKSNNSIFAKIIKAAEEGKTEFPFTTGMNQYDFIDVNDLALQIAIACTQNDVLGIINCCSGKPVTLKEKVNNFILDNKLNISLKYGAFPDRSYDSKIIYGDSDKIKSILDNAVVTDKVLDRLNSLKRRLKEVDE